MRPAVLAIRAWAALVLACVAGCDHGAATTRKSATRSALLPDSGEDPGAPSAARRPPKTGVECTPDPTFPASWDVAEASAAVELSPRPGQHNLLVLSDSGNKGEAMTWPLGGGPLTSLHLELDTLASDDIEGAAWMGGHLYTLTSSGAVRRYTPSAKGDLLRDRSAYAIGAPPYVCDTLYDGNCGKNYEGLCLRSPAKKARCAGYAASKTEGALYCVVLRGDSLAVDPTRPPILLDVRRKALSDCAFGAVGGPAEDVLIVTTNIYGGSVTYVVDEATGALSAIDLVGTPNNEAVAIDHTGALYQFMDSNTTASSARRATCQGWSTSAAR